MSVRRLREAASSIPCSIGSTPCKAVESEHEYLRRSVDPVLMPLIESLLLYQPESVYHFIHDFVDERKANRFTHRPRSMGYAKKLSNRRKMTEFMSTSVIPVMNDLAKQILLVKPNSVKDFIRDVVATRISIGQESSGNTLNQVDSNIQFQVHDRILCRYKGRPRFFPGIITAKDNTGNFTILYDDGKIESSVHSMCLKPYPAVNDKGAGMVTEHRGDHQRISEIIRTKMAIVLLIVGIDGAGKSTLLSTLQGDLDKEHVPSAGFTSATFQTEKGSATFYDLGGGLAFRNVWKEYYADVHGVIFVVDSSSELSVLQAANVLEETMSTKLMTSKPLLIFANKRDHSGAVAEHEMQNLLRLHNFPGSKIVPCVAKPAVYSGAVDLRLETGLQWLFDQIYNDFDALHDRVEHDLALKRKFDEQRRDEQRARVSRWKEERELHQMRTYDKHCVENRSTEVSRSEAAADSPEDTVICCSNCNSTPAETKCAASKWLPVCGNCATLLRGQTA